VRFETVQDRSRLSWGKLSSCQMHLFSGKCIMRLIAEGVLAGISHAAARLFGGTDGLESRQAQSWGLPGWSGATPSATCYDASSLHGRHRRE
jgi:hypothetical protein